MSGPICDWCQEHGPSLVLTVACPAGHTNSYVTCQACLSTGIAVYVKRGRLGPDCMVCDLPTTFAGLHPVGSVGADLEELLLFAEESLARQRAAAET